MRDLATLVNGLMNSMEAFRRFLGAPERHESLCLHDAVWRGNIKLVEKFLESKKDPSGLFKDDFNGSRLDAYLEFHKKMKKFDSYYSKLPVYLWLVVGGPSLLSNKIQLNEKITGVLFVSLLGSFPYYWGTLESHYSDLVPDKATIANWPPLFLAAFRGNIGIAKLLINAGANIAYQYNGYNFLSLAEKLGQTEFHKEISKYLLEISQYLKQAKLGGHADVNILAQQYQLMSDKNSSIKEKFKMIMPVLNDYKCVYKETKQQMWVYFSNIEKRDVFLERFNSALNGATISITAKASRTKNSKNYFIRFSNVTPENLASLAPYQNQLKSMPVPDMKKSHRKYGKNRLNLTDSSPTLFPPSAPRFSDTLLLDSKESRPLTVSPSHESSGTLFSQTADRGVRIDKGTLNRENDHTFG